MGKKWNRRIGERALFRAPYSPYYTAYTDYRKPPHLRMWG